MSSTLLLLSLTVASVWSLPVAPGDRERDNTMAASRLPNVVDFGAESSWKFARSAEAGADEANERGTAGPSEREAPRLSTPKDEPYAASGKKGRKHRAFFLSSPLASHVQRYRRPSGYETIRRISKHPTEKRRTGNKRKLHQESQIYYIRLPPTPYSYVPGFGYISQPPTYSTAGLQRPATSHAQRPTRPQQNSHHKKPSTNQFINVPIDFVSNGKPTGVYKWPGSKRPDTTFNSLNEGPYAFNGKPTSLYLLNADGKQTGHQPIRLADYSSNGYY